MLGCASGTRLKYRLTLVSGLLECLCFAGVVFGWASLVFVLKADGYFEDLCSNVTESNNTLLDEDCSRQDEKFALVFTVASFLNNFMTLPIGFIFDRFGTLATRLVAICLYTSGTALIAASRAALSVLLFPAVSLIAVGGILLLVTNMQVGNLFGKHRSTIITLYNGAFDSSSAVFLVIKVLFEFGISLRLSFIVMSACSVIHVLRTIFLLPVKHIPHPVPEGYSYGYNVEKFENARTEKNMAAKRQMGRYSDSSQPGKHMWKTAYGLSPEMSFRSCVASWLFVWHLLWLSVMQLRHYLFIGTLNPMLNRLANQDPTLVSEYTNAFAFTQLCGVLCAPWNGLIMDRHKGKPLPPEMSDREADLRSSVLSLFLTSLQCLLFSVCATYPLLPLQYLTFALQVINRSFLYGGNAAFISIAFPSQHFGKLYGLVMSLSALVSLLQYPCFALVKEFDGEPLYVNIGLTVLTLVAFIHPLNVYFHCRKCAGEREGPDGPLSKSSEVCRDLDSIQMEEME
ncbi:solute carrier family 43 member 3a [Engraulis encrasicolus]|uniref:solute carrier family 43 member 3a n=1 Tax=Engraulis encrasicolus TaxID=184585 RepID=UPI002FCF7CCF